MCIPSLEEFSDEGESDTSGETDNTVMLGVQHKYPFTALILATNRCAMYCRHCFRKRMVGATEAEINSNFLATVDYITHHKEINNILITAAISPPTIHTQTTALLGTPLSLTFENEDGISPSLAME